MIDFKFNTSNNISFPAEERTVMLLIDGEYFRLKIEKSCEFHQRYGVDSFYEATLTYTLYKEDDGKNKLGFAKLRLNTEAEYWTYRFAKRIGHDEIPKDYFELERIWFNENVRVKGLGTGLLNYVMSDVIKFNELHGTNLKVLLERDNTNITLPFYKKFGARENKPVDEFAEFRRRVEDETTPLIIDEPKTVGEVPLELADDFDYEKEGWPNKFTAKKLKR